MTDNSKFPLNNPVNIATAATAVDALSLHSSIEDLLTLSRNCSNALVTVNKSIVEYLDSEEYNVIVFSLLAVKDIAVAKAIAAAREEGRA